MAAKSIASYFGLGEDAFGNFSRPYTDTLQEAASAASQENHRAAVLGYTEAFPTLMAFIQDNDPATIFLGACPHFYRAVPGVACAADDHAVAFLGNTEDTIVPFVLADTAFSRAMGGAAVNVLTDTAAHHADYSALAAGTTHLNPYVAGPNVETVRPRRAIVLPPDLAQNLVGTPNSRMTFEQFWTQVIQPLVAADPIGNKPIIDWWKAATVMNAGGHSLAIAFPQPSVTDLTFFAWSRRTVASMLSHVPNVTAPGLNHVVNAVQGVAQQLTATETNRLDELRAKSNMSFTDRYGAPLARLLHRYCRVGADNLLPAVHILSATNDKRSRDTANINICLYTESLECSWMNAINLPKVSPWVLEIFRLHDLVGNGLELGSGLNPFSVICAGHHNTKDVLLLAERQATVEAGAAISLQDSMEFKTKDARFPKTYLQASDKLWAMALIVRVYFGHRHVLYTNLVASLELVCPLIQNLESVFASSKKEGLLIAIRAMLGYQSKVQMWLRSARATSAADLLVAPDFSRICEAMESQTYDSLPRVPDMWMEVVKTQVHELWEVVVEPQRIRGGGGGAGGGGMLPPLSKNKCKVPAKPTTMRRWKKALGQGYKNIGDLKNNWNGAGEYCIPVDPAGKEICLTGQLKGECKNRCPNKETHLAYGDDTIAKIEQFLTDCGVPL